MTRLLLPKEYPTKYWTREDIIQYFVDHKDPQPEGQVNELRPDTRKHPMQFSEVAKRCFAKDIIKYLLP